MPIITLTFRELGDVAPVATLRRHGEGAVYDFRDDGRIHLQPAFYGMPERHAVTISLGREGGDESGHGLSGLRLDDRLLTGVVMCDGPELQPRPHPSHPRDYPLAELQGPAYERAALLLSTIAFSFHDLVNGRW